MIIFIEKYILLKQVKSTSDSTNDVHAQGVIPVLFLTLLQHINNINNKGKEQN